MSLEDDFPSFSKAIDNKEGYLSSVEKFCLDKQKVREAIHKGFEKAGIFDTPSHIRTSEQEGRGYALFELEKELGLSEVKK
jgi:hypothetical protein